MGKSENQALEALLYQIELLARHGKLPDAIGLDWIEVATLLNKRGFGVLHEDPVIVDGGSEVDFDINLLEHSSRAATGFAGVYTSGSSFRALVPNPDTGGSKHLRSRATALQAAIDRYEWFERFGLPYGNLGAYVEEYKLLHPGTTTEAALVAAQTMAGEAISKPFTKENAEATLKRYRQVHGSDVAPEPEVLPATPKQLPAVHKQLASGPLEAEEVVCAVCKERLVGRLVFVVNTDHPAHPDCVDLQGRPFGRQLA